MAKLIVGQNDLATVNPDLATEWHPTMNGSLLPSQITAGSNRKVWWLGKCGHEWEAGVSSRNKGSGCPYCSGHRAIAGVNDLATLNPELVAEWHPTKNGCLRPSQVKSKSNKKVWWLGKCGHEWEAAIHSRAAGSGCPYCSGNKVLVGYNDLASIVPELAVEWHPSKNGELKPTQVTGGSTKKVWWLGKCGHEWEAAVHTRVKGHGCPYCSNIKVLAGVNDLASRRPDCLNWWEYSKNYMLGILPTAVMPGSKDKVWWHCPEDHVWNQPINSFLRKRSSCPICSGRRCQQGENDLATVNPDLAAEWSPTKNVTLLPTQITANSNKKVWWLGKCGHEWEATICSRTAGNGCPFCSNKRVLPGFNDLATAYPKIAEEWNYKRNGALSPENFTYGSERKVWWVCSKCGYEWETTINNRTNGYFKTGCPKCSGEHSTSFPEQAILYYIRQYVDQNAESRFKIKIGGKEEELDVWIPSLTCGIEYDGEYYHAGRGEKDAEKDHAAANSSIRLIRLIECGHNAIEGDRIYLDVRHHQKRNIERAVQHVVALLAGHPVSLDMEADTAAIMSNYKLEKEKSSVKALFPELAKQWDYERNGTLLPENISYGSERKVWWICPVCGGSFLKSVNTRTATRTRNLQHCPYCPTRKGEASRKPVICLETGKTYPSAEAAAAEVSRTGGAISAACREGTKSAGFHWKYASEYDN